MSRASDLKHALRNTWLHPRYISTRYLRTAMSGASAYAHGVLLDTGSGLSPYRDLFHGRVERYVRVDWPQSWNEAPPDLIGDAQRLPFRDGSVDTILATELIEHLPQPQQFLKEARRLLRAGGVLIVSAPFMEPVHEEPRDFRRFTEYGLRGIVEENGFVVRNGWTRGGFWSVVVGSFSAQVLFNCVSPPAANGRRSWTSALIAPFLAILQWTGWVLDRVVQSKRYALGYVVAASREEAPE